MGVWNSLTMVLSENVSYRRVGVEIVFRKSW